MSRLAQHTVMQELGLALELHQGPKLAEMMVQVGGLITSLRQIISMSGVAGCREMASTALTERLQDESQPALDNTVESNQ